MINFIICDDKKEFVNKIDEIISKVPNAEKISIKTVDKLLKHDNAAICFMSCTNIYEILNKFEELLKNKNK